MCNNNIKKWTILIYADGNNDMESTIYKSFLSCEKAGSNKDVNVIIEIGKLGNYITNDKDSWYGVRRYYIEKGHSDLIENLGRINIADPNNLYNFIKWGCKNYKSEHLMLVISGHGGNFIGCLTDLSQDVPYIMGIPEMVEAINSVKKDLGYTIDTLIFDMCYMNYIEIIYELGHEKKPAVKTVVNYMGHASYDGIDYISLIFTTQKYSSIQDISLFIKHLIDNQRFNLVAYEINHEKLEKIKLLFNDAAKTSNNLLDALKNPTINNINDKLKSIVIYSKNEFKGLNYSINVTSNDIKYLIIFYDKLAFSKDNLWRNLLSSVSLDKLKINKNKIYVFPPNSSLSIIHYILNFHKTCI